MLVQMLYYLFAAINWQSDNIDAHMSASLEKYVILFFIHIDNTSY